MVLSAIPIISIGVTGADYLLKIRLVNTVVEINAERNVIVKYPRWSFLASGKNKAELEVNFVSALSNVLISKYDILMVSIKNAK